MTTADLNRDAPAQDVVLTADEGAVRVLTLNRPQVRNAIDMPLRIALAEALEEADRDPEVRAVVIVGAGPIFSAGGDIATMRRMAPAEARPRAEAAQRVVRAIWGTAKPVVAAVEGAAYGAGLSLALACDRVVTGDSATFSASFTRIGLAGDMGIFASLQARVGPARARQMLMLPDPINAHEALVTGIADEIVPAGEARVAALYDATRLAAGPALALGAIKSMLSGVPRAPLDTLDLEVEHQVRLFDSDDFAEGAAAFREKRTARFRAISHQESI